MQLTKDWINVDYNGVDLATFTAAENTGEARSVEVSFIDASRTIVVKRFVNQASAPVPEDIYTRLSWIEATGDQWIDTGYIVKETDVIEMDYISMLTSSADKMLFGAVGSGTAVWFSVYNQTGYVRFGQSSSTQVNSIQTSYRFTLQKGKVVLGDTSTTLAYTGKMPDNTLVLFSNHLASGDISSAKAVARCSYFRIKNNGEFVINMYPAKRNADGAIGMLDVVSGNFYPSDSDVPFLGGSEVQVPEGYEIMDYVTFNADKVYDAGIIDSTMAIDVMYERSESSSNPYLFGVITSPHTATVSAYMASGGAWRWGSSSRAISTNNQIQHRVQIKNGQVIFDITNYTVSKSAAFVTPDTLLVGGYRSSSGTINRNYKGRIYYFKVTDGGVPVVDWLPCKRLSDGVVGFWDCVTQSFVEEV
jgi:hypothetical protein